MKFAKFGIVLGTLALGLIFAAGHQMVISSPTWVNGKELEPGDYKLRIPSEDINGKQQVEEVDLGGTKTTILFKSGSSGSAGGE